MLYRKLRLTDSVRGSRIVIVDDVMASGAHIRAAQAKLLIDGGAAAIALAICAGRADSQEVADPFAIRHEWLTVGPPQRSIRRAWEGQSALEVSHGA